MARISFHHPIVLELDEELARGPHLASIAADVAAIRDEARMPVIIVHSARPEQDRREVLALNVEVCSALLLVDAAPVGLHGASSNVVLARSGVFSGINTMLLSVLGGAGYTPVIACLGADESGTIFDVEPGLVAAAVAARLGARALVRFGERPGILRDPTDASSRIDRMTVAAYRQAVARREVPPSTIPHLEQSFGALSANGAISVLLVGPPTGRVLRRALADFGSVGTVILRE